MQTVLERERVEWSRQSRLFQQYFDQKRIICEARLAKFLRLYPYRSGAEGADLCRFERAIKTAGTVRRASILRAYESERSYCSSAYAADHCSGPVYINIHNTLAEMGRILYGDAGVDRFAPMHAPERRPIRQAAGPNRPEPEKQSPPKVGGSWGKPGEKAVDYVLKWLPAGYHTITKDCTGKYGKGMILLKNPAFSDEPQEFDHLVIGPQGIFNIETKYYSGKLKIDQYGNWTRLKKGASEWIPVVNPAQQVFRHHTLLQSITGDQIPIIDIICMAHPELMMTGQEHSQTPVIKCDLLGSFITGYDTKALTPEQAEAITARIETHKVNWEPKAA